MNYIKIPEYSSYPYHDNKSKFIAIVHSITNTIQTITNVKCFINTKQYVQVMTKKIRYLLVLSTLHSK